MAKNLGGSAVQAQTEGIRILSEEEAAAQQLSAPATIYVAKKVITMEPDRPDATAVGVAGGRILAVGSLDDVEEAMGREHPYDIDHTFEQKVIMPGFVEHHVHPLLGALTMSLEIISIEDWSVPGKFAQGAYLKVGGWVRP